MEMEGPAGNSGTRPSTCLEPSTTQPACLLPLSCLRRQESFPGTGPPPSGDSPILPSWPGQKLKETEGQRGTPSASPDLGKLSGPAQDNTLPTTLTV